MVFLLLHFLGICMAHDFQTYYPFSGRNVTCISSESPTNNSISKCSSLCRGLSVCLGFAWTPPKFCLPCDDGPTLDSALDILEVTEPTMVYAPNCNEGWTYYGRLEACYRMIESALVTILHRSLDRMVKQAGLLAYVLDAEHSKFLRSLSDRPIMVDFGENDEFVQLKPIVYTCLLYTSPSPRDRG